MDHQALEGYSLTLSGLLLWLLHHLTIAVNLLLEISSQHNLSLKCFMNDIIWIETMRPWEGIKGLNSTDDGLKLFLYQQARLWTRKEDLGVQCPNKEVIMRHEIKKTEPWFLALGWMMDSWPRKDIWPESKWPPWKTLNKEGKGDNYLDKPMEVAPLEDNKMRWIKVWKVPSVLYHKNIGREMRNEIILRASESLCQ